MAPSKKALCNIHVASSPLPDIQKESRQVFDFASLL